MKHRSDGEIMKLLAQGNRKAFDELFRRHGARVLGYCTRLCGDRPTGEDVAQDVWIRVVRNANRYEPSPSASLEAWLLTIARHSSLNSLRSRARFDDLEPVELERELENRSLTRESIEDLLVGAVDTTRAKRAVDELPPSQRSVLVLWMSEDLSYEKIAEELGLTESAVKSLLFRARRTLESALKEG